MKQSIFILFIFCFSFSVNAQYFQKGESAYSEGNFLKINTSGEILQAGLMACKMQVDTMLIKSYECDSTSTNLIFNFFIYKTNSQGSVLWEIHSSNSNKSSITLSDLLTDNSNNIYLIGLFSDTLFIEQDTLVSFSKNDIFIAKWDNNAQLQWVNSNFTQKDSSEIELAGAKLNASNEIVFWGASADSVAFGGQTLYSSKKNAFAAKINTSTQSIQLLQYAEAKNTISYSKITAADVASDNSVYAFYAVSDTVILHTNSLTDTIKNGSSEAYFWGKIPTAGNFVNLKTESSLKANNLFLGKDNDIYITSVYSHALSSSDFSTINPVGKKEIFLGKYRTNGQFVWGKNSKNASGTAEAVITGISQDDKQNIYLSGFFGENSATSTFSFDTKKLSSVDSYDAFLIKIDTAGTVVWAQSMGDNGDDILFDVETLNENYILGIGKFSKSVQSEHRRLNNNYGYSNLFAGNLDPYPDFTVNLTKTNSIVCENDSVLFSVANNPAYQYTWYRNDTLMAGETSNFVYVKDSAVYFAKVFSTTDNYQKQSNADSLSWFPAPENTIENKDTSVLCQSETAYLSTTYNAANDFQWLLNAQNLPDDTLNYLYAGETGYYKVMVTDSNGCFSLSDSIHIQILNYPDSNVVSPEGKSFCAGDSIVLKAEADNNYSYQWYLDTIQLNSASDSIFYASTNGIYTVEIVNQNLCKSKSYADTVVVLNTPVSDVSITPDTLFCVGDSSFLQSKATGVGLLYTWYFNGDSIPGKHEKIISVKNTGKYKLYVQYEGGCGQFSPEYNFSEISRPVATIYPDKDTVFCENSFFKFSTDTSSNYGYQWYLNNSPLIDATESIWQADTTGTYKVEINNGACSSVSASVVLTEIPVPQFVVVADTNRLCSGDSTLLQTPVNENYSYKWLLNNNSINWPDTNLIYAKEYGYYSLQITDVRSNCVSVSEPMLVTVYISPEAEIETAKTTICERENLTLYSFYKHKNYTYAWYRDNNFMTEGTADSTVINQAGDYFLQIKDTNNCSAKSPVVTINALVNPKPLVNRSENYLSTRQAPVIQWYKNNHPITEFGDEAVYIVKESGFYSVKLTYANGCEAYSDSVGVCIPLAKIYAEDDVLKTFNQAQTYQWFYFDDSIKGAVQYAYRVQQSGEYSVQISSENCSMRSNQISICLPIPYINQLNDTVLEAPVGTNYQWYKDSFAMPGETNRYLQVTQSGSYQVELTSPQGCTSMSPEYTYIQTGISRAIPYGIKIYPNPANYAINIEFEKFDEAIISIYDLKHRLLYHRKLTENKSGINISQFEKGVYFIKIQLPQYVFYQRIIKN